MALYRPNTQEEEYCYGCRRDVNSAELKQCARCKNWFCGNDIASVDDSNSLSGECILLCLHDQGVPTLT